MKPWLEIDAQDLVGHFPSIDFLGAIDPDAAGRAGVEVDGGERRRSEVESAKIQSKSVVRVEWVKMDGTR